ncbi:TerB family tellurite resistance protein [Flavobacteriaceae bacterium]|jgi:uncharacterized tellurite resistance protein B-like protein|uniref:tellurite resistance TerB family protein n=1 Tax=Candidatus Arcticimaribacter forsetii TaxID=2820661 RepID=UPI0020770DCD|nr:TerB family tellurite resistance protein [Candidatus Arcticimaribacter forsetii]MCH1539450.1 TerB family tellurite resistance protein [Flavobacteriaceae bacterium]MDA8640103.1 TerB family tellurite resistance protein [Flavobacteriaceae bacterium]MDB2326083.1 TerB family tellurite resistance protein [Flavobacteriaceae bacterium]MDB2345886.1 TerB family tellurite resistance protein [Flavobacteriaceae bacterium]MDB2457033.1 TerB family tellurite resistance protein [Flavobacteriaceae bacterium]
MSISDIYSSGFKKRNRDHFAAIVQIAQADGTVTDEEQKFLDRMAINLEIEDEEYQKILSNSSNYNVNPPANEERRLERLFDLTRIIYADHIADDNEKELLNRLVIGLGFTENSNEVVTKALNFVSEGKDEDEFIAAFKK